MFCGHDLQHAGRASRSPRPQKADAMVENRILNLKPSDPDVSSGVDALTREMSSLRGAVVDPKADEIQRLATLVGPDGNRARAIVQAFGPLMLPHCGAHLSRACEFLGGFGC